jgi:hypothetical protein
MRKMRETMEVAKKVIKELHPYMNPEEPCTVYEAYHKINDVLKGD